MSRLSIFVPLAALIASCGHNTQEETTTVIIPMEYPETRKDTSVKDVYHSVEVSDPYRWLENDTSKETEEWVAKENQLTFAYLEGIPYRDSIKNRLTELWNYEKYSAPFERGGFIYYFKNDGLQNQSVLYRKKGEQGTPEVFLDPNKFSKDGVKTDRRQWA